MHIPLFIRWIIKMKWSMFLTVWIQHLPHKGMLSMSSLIAEGHARCKRATETTWKITSNIFQIMHWKNDPLSENMSMRHWAYEAYKSSA